MTKDVALVLSSGGARGLAHIGAIEELEAQGYRITSIAGCSMGALIGGVYAAGKLKEFREWMKTVDRKKMLELTDFSLSINHIAKGSRILEAIMEFVPDMPIEDLPIPYCAVATDLKAGREVVFRKGSLFDACHVSGAGHCVDIFQTVQEEMASDLKTQRSHLCLSGSQLMLIGFDLRIFEMIHHLIERSGDLLQFRTFFLRKAQIQITVFDLIHDSGHPVQRTDDRTRQIICRDNDGDRS